MSPCSSSIAYAMLKRASLRVRATSGTGDRDAHSTLLIARLKYVSSLIKHCTASVTPSELTTAVVAAFDAISAAQTAAGKELACLQTELGACAPPTFIAHSFLPSSDPASYRALCDAAQSSASAHGHRLAQLGKSTQSLSAAPLGALRASVKAHVTECASRMSDRSDRAGSSLTLCAASTLWHRPRRR